MIFTFSGKWQSKKRMGFVADFCPVCREITPFSIHRFAIREHFNGISLGAGRTLGHAGFCTRCGIQIAMDATVYADFAKVPGERIDELVKQTFPYLRQARSERLALEEKMRMRRLTPWEREKLMLEPLAVVSELCEAKFGGGNLLPGWRGAFGFLGGLGLAIIILLVMESSEDQEEYRKPALLAALGIFLTGVIYLVVNLIKEPRRIYSQKFLPLLVKSLEPLHPGKEEIEKYLERYKRSGFNLGKRADAEELREAIRPAKAAFVAPDFRK